MHNRLINYNAIIYIWQKLLTRIYVGRGKKSHHVITAKKSRYYKKFLYL